MKLMNSHGSSYVFPVAPSRRKTSPLKLVGVEKDRELDRWMMLLRTRMQCSMAEISFITGRPLSTVYHRFGLMTRRGMELLHGA